MTDNEIRIAIAEKCGTFPGVWVKEKNEIIRWKDERGCEWHRSAVLEKLPDYPNDLNAMHKAESVVFNKKDWTRYTDFLIDLVPKDQSPIRATARQRAEAFCRTLGIWKE